ncbi:MAG TPA: BON domain-containing protein [Thermomicrobiales bacterium]|nr:BON domain-containing protein [Thermomicrobiales bacterium]
MATKQWVDRDIQQDVLDEFAWDPEVDIPEVGVEVDDGVVTLTGTVDQYRTKLAAQRAAQRVSGVRAVANDLTVRGPLTHNDTDIAQDAARAIEANLSIPRGAVDIVVQNGKVTLTGQAPWAYQRVAAEESVRYLRGVRDVVNLIAVKSPQVSDAEVRAGIERALVRAAELDADRIRVRAQGGQVTLSGTTRTWTEKQEAGRAAWRARGVDDVVNEIEIRPY